MASRRPNSPASRPSSARNGGISSPPGDATSSGAPSSTARAVPAGAESRYRAVAVRADADTLTVRLDDGREISAPYRHFPRLARATAAQRARWELIGRGTGIHWPELDEDVSVFSIVHPGATRPNPFRCRTFPGILLTSNIKAWGLNLTSSPA